MPCFDSICPMAFALDKRYALFLLTDIDITLINWAHVPLTRMQIINEVFFLLSHEENQSSKYQQNRVRLRKFLQFDSAKLLILLSNILSETTTIIDFKNIYIYIYI
ncbi:unnamed protein product [Musa hybrid cultivar]